MHRAGRLAGGVAFVATVGWVRREVRDAGDLERLRVRPRGVDVAVHEEDRPVGEIVEQILRRCSAGEMLHRPAAAEDPGALGVLGGVSRHGVAIRGHPGQIVERDVHPVPTRERRVDVRILEPRQHHPPGQVHHLGGGAGRSRTSASVPTATIRPSRIAIACAHRRAASIV